MTSPLPAFPATIWVGHERPKRRKRPFAPRLTPVDVDAATWLAGLTPVEVAHAVFWKNARLPSLATDQVWLQPHLASLRSAWEQAKAQSVINGDPFKVRMTLDLSARPLMEWLYRNQFATLLRFASLCLHVDGELVRVTVGRVGTYIDDGGNVKTVMLSDISDLTYSRANMDSHDLVPVVDAVTTLVRFCATTKPEMEVDLMYSLIPYLVGSTPQDRWMSTDRALAYRAAGVTSGEARRWEFGAAANRPTSEALVALAALYGTSRRVPGGRASW